MGYDAISTIDSTTASTLYFSFSNLPPGQIQMSQVSLHTPDFTFMGEMMDFSATVYGYSANALSAWGTIDHVMEHGCSYDPNDIAATPKGYTSAHYIEDGTEIEYLIRFQNTGNAPALNVRIDNSISENLDLSSFQLAANSHDVSVAIDQVTREIKFFFNNIMLPDSNSNEQESHGFISYRISVLEPLATGTEIHNTASIYFDNNPAVVTNTTLHTIYNCEEFTSDLILDDSQWCETQTVNISTSAPWADEYIWSVNGQLASESESLNITQPGESLVELMVDNPLCGMFQQELTLNLVEVLPQSIVSSATVMCAGESVELSAANTSASYLWSLNGTTLSTDSSIDVSEAGTYELTTTIGECVQSNSVLIEVTPMPEASITQSENTLSTVENIEWTYQWYLNNEPISGATSNTYEITSSGIYDVVVLNGNCSGTAQINATYLSVTESSDASWLWYPNPVESELILESKQLKNGQQIQLVDVTGRVVYSSVMRQARLAIDMSSLPTGVYTMMLDNGETLGRVIKK